MNKEHRNDQSKRKDTHRTNEEVNGKADIIGKADVIGEAVCGSTVVRESGIQKRQQLMSETAFAKPLLPLRKSENLSTVVVIPKSSDKVGITNNVGTKDKKPLLEQMENGKADLVGKQTNSNNQQKALVTETTTPNTPRQFEKLTKERLSRRYKDISLVRFGTFGSVWSVTCPKQGLVAVKSQDFDTQHGIVGEVLREIDILTRLKHPRILKILDVFPLTSAVDITMEAYNRDISSFIRHTPLIKRLQLIDQVFLGLSDALAFLHQNGVYHLDIKSSNILISTSGLDLRANSSSLGPFKRPYIDLDNQTTSSDTSETRQRSNCSGYGASTTNPRYRENAEIKVVLCDFGLSCVNTLDVANPRIKFCSEHCRPPELLKPSADTYKRDSNSLNKIDVWSLGCVFAEYVLGKYAFWKYLSEDMQVLQQILVSLEANAEECRWCNQDFVEIEKLQKQYNKPCGLWKHLSLICPTWFLLLQKMLTILPDKRLTSQSAFELVKTTITLNPLSNVGLRIVTPDRHASVEPVTTTQERWCFRAHDGIDLNNPAIKYKLAQVEKTIYQLVIVRASKSTDCFYHAQLLYIRACEAPQVVDFLATSPISNNLTLYNQQQLLASTCSYLAIKYKHYMYPDLSVLCGLESERRSILELELKVLEALCFKLS